ncbi:MAG: hypothetical protein OXT73_03355 [Bacteroidota bacterium]|nr:hypothetical protein [Bacteroidota bacterium]
MPRYLPLLLILLLPACQPAEQAAPALPAGELVDMSYAYNGETVYWPTAPGFEKSTDFEGTTDAGFWYPTTRVGVSAGKPV